MFFTYLSPNWFSGYDVTLELIFAIIATIISAFAFKIYRTTNLKQIKLFSISFGFIALSYVVQAIFNTAAIMEVHESNILMELKSIVFLKIMGLYTHMVLTIIGLCILAYMTFKIDKTRVLWLMLIISILGIFLSVNNLFIFFIFSVVYLMAITWHFITNYLEHKEKKTLLIVTAFLFLLFGNLHFIMSVNHQLFYVIGHILELIAYMLILINFYLVLKK